MSHCPWCWTQNGLNCCIKNRLRLSSMVINLSNAGWARRGCWSRSMRGQRAAHQAVEFAIILSLVMSFVIFLFPLFYPCDPLFCSINSSFFRNSRDRREWPLPLLQPPTVVFPTWLQDLIFSCGFKSSGMIMDSTPCVALVADLTCDAFFVDEWGGD